MPALRGAATLDGMSTNGVRQAGNTRSLGVTSSAFGVLTCVTAVVAMGRWTSSDDSALLVAGLVLAFGGAAIATGTPGRAAGQGDADGAGFALAGLLMGALGIVATIGYMVLSVAYVIGLYVVIGMLYGDEMYPDETLIAAVLGAGL